MYLKCSMINCFLNQIMSIFDQKDNREIWTVVNLFLKSTTLKIFGWSRRRLFSQESTCLTNLRIWVQDQKSNPSVVVQPCDPRASRSPRGSLASQPRLNCELHLPGRDIVLKRMEVYPRSKPEVDLWVLYTYEHICTASTYTDVQNKVPDKFCGAKEILFDVYISKNAYVCYTDKTYSGLWKTAP